MTRRADSIKASVIRKIFDKAAMIKGVVNLSIGQPDLPVPEITKQAMIRAIQNNKTGYTPSVGLKSLQEKILSKYSGLKCAESVIVTSGVSGGIFLTYACLLEEGDEIIVISPYFVMYPDLANFMNIKPVIVESKTDFSPDLNKIKKAITKKTRAIIINSPNNPTGYILNENELKTIAKIARDNDLWIISDEVYEVFDYEKKFQTMAKYYDKTIVLNGYSKSLALTGLRIGYAVGPKEVIADMIKLQQYTFVCAPSITQYAVDETFNLMNVQKMVHCFKKRRNFVFKELNKNLKLLKPAGAFYYFIPLPTKIKSEFFVEKCLEKKLLVVPGEAFMTKEKGQKYFRISYAVDEKTLKKGIKIIREVLKALENK